MNKLSSRNINAISYIVVGLFAALYLFVLSSNSIYRFEMFEQEGDLAAYENAIYHTSNGDMFKTTVAGSVMKYWPTRGTKKPPYPTVPENFSLLGIHFMPSLLITNVIPYKIFPSTYTTLILQTLAITVTGMLLLYLGILLNLPIWMRLIAPIIFLFHPANIGANLNAFHPILMALPFVVAAVIFIEKSQWKLYAVCFLIIAGMKESAPLALIGLSAFIFFKHGRKKALINFIIASITFLLITKVLIPFFNEDGSLPYGTAYGSPLGNSMGHIILNSLLKPILFLKTIFSSAKIVWLTYLLLPVFFLVLLSPSGIILVGLSLAPNLVSQSASMHTLWGQYNALAMPFIFIGAFWGYQNLIKILNKYVKGEKQVKIITCIMAILFTGFGSYGLFSEKKNFGHISIRHVFMIAFTTDWNIEQRTKESTEILNLIPKDATLSAPDTFLTKSHARPESYIYPVHKELVDYVVYKKQTPWITPEQQAVYTKELIEAGFEQVAENSKLVLMKKKSL